MGDKLARERAGSEREKRGLKPKCLVLALEIEGNHGMGFTIKNGRGKFPPWPSSVP